MTPNEWRDRTIQVFRDLDSTELPDAAYQCAVYAANEDHPLHEAALDVFAALAGIDALVAANRRLAAERDDLHAQIVFCRQVAGEHEGDYDDADWHRILAYTGMTSADRARDAEERAGIRAEPEPKQSPAFWICAICGAANEAGERSCARCDRDSAADDTALSRAGY